MMLSYEFNRALSNFQLSFLNFDIVGSIYDALRLIIDLSFLKASTRLYER